VILVIVIPIPARILDVFLGLNLLLAILILLLVLFTKKVTDFSTLPTLILISVVFSLAIITSVSRPILTNGAEFDGRVISFISNIIGGSGETVRLWIGFAIFYSFATFLLIVITKGTTGVAEAGARFTLDSMQVRMMAIETKISSGTITEDQAQVQKQEIIKESDFLGSLDAAMKFVSGNAKIIYFVIYIIFIGGTVIECFIRDTALNEAFKIYVHLSIGSGIVFMLPVFLLATSSRIFVNRFLDKQG
jgi:flagellar biosynthesis protein FlhA